MARNLNSGLDSLALAGAVLGACALLFSGCNKDGKTIVDPNANFGPIPGGGVPKGGGGGTNQAPNAAADAYNASGGATLTVNAATGVLANDTDPDGNTPLSATAFNGNSTQNGAVNLATDGSFTYTSAAGFTGTDTFSYTLNDALGATATGTVTITVTGTSWYVDNTGSATGVGTQADPFDSLAKAQTASAAGDTIFLLNGDGTSNNHTAGIVLKTGQRLIGQGATPRLANAGAAGITLADGCTVSGVFVDGVNNAIEGTGTAGSTLTNVTILNASAGVSLTNATGTHTITGLNVTASNAGLAFITSPAGTFDVSGVTVTTTGGAPGAALFCQTGGTVNWTGTNTISATGTGGIQATGTALNVTLASLSTTNSPAQGIELTNCTGTLTVTGTTAIANNASLGGIQISGANAPTATFGVTNVTNRNAFGIDVTAAAGAISFGATTITGNSASPAVNHQGSGANLSFASLSVTGGTQQGINLNNNTGTFTVTGATTLDGQTLAALRVQAAQSTVNFGQLTVDNRNAEGILLEATSGTITFGGPTAINARAGGTATAVRGNTCGATVVFNTSIAVADSGGAGVQLTTCTANWTFNGASIQSTTGDGVLVDGTSTGTFTFPANGTIATTTGNAIFVNGGSATLTYTGAITNTSGNLLRVQNTTAGAVSVTGAGGGITDTAGAGILTLGAVGTVSVSNFTITNSTANGISITGGSGAHTFTNGAITGGNRSLVIGSGSTAVTFNGGSFNYAGANECLAVNLGHTGTLTFNAAHTITSTAGNGLDFDNADGTYAFNGTTNVTGGARSLRITNGSAGTFTFGANTSLTSPTGTVVEVNGSTCGVTYSGNVTQATAGQAALNVVNHTTGTLTFQTNTISATNGTGLQFDNADGTYAFNGTATLNGGDAGIDITNGSGGTFTFGANTAITSPTGTGFNLVGGTAAVTYSGGITQANNALAVSVSGGHATGTVTFQTGTISATNGNGLQFNDADGTYNCNGTATLNGGNAGVDIINGSGGTFTFATGTTITSPTGSCVDIAGGTATVTFSGSLTQANNAPAVLINGGHATGTVTFQTGTINATNGTGLQFDNADGPYNFNGTTTLNGGDAGIDILNGSGGTFTFATGTTITSPTGTGFNLVGGTAVVTYSGNVTQANNAAAVSISGGHATGTVTFQTGTINATSGTGLQFDNADGPYNFNGTATLNGGDAGIDILNGSGGTFTFGSNTTITNPTGVSFLLISSTANVTYSGNVNHNSAGSNGILISNYTVGTLTFNTGTLTFAGTGNQVSISNSSGTINFDGTTSVTGGTVGVSLSNVTGAVDFDAGGTHTMTLTTSNTAISVTGGSPTFTYTGAVSVQSGVLFSVQSTTGGSVTIAGNVANALDSTNGTLGIRLQAVAGNASFDNFRLTGNTTTAAIDISTGSTGTFAFTNGAIVNPVNVPCVRLDGGTCTANFVGGSITTAGTGAAISVSGGHATGTLSFNATTAITATNGTGLQFSNADGTYTFSGTTTLNGGDAGVDVNTGSEGSFTFAGTSAITNPSGDAVFIDGLGASSNFAYTGAIANNSSRIIRIENTTAGSTATFTSAGAGIVDNGGTGIRINNCAGNVSFNTFSVLNSTSTGVTMLGATNDGTFTFSNPTITDPADRAWNIDNGACNVTVTGGATSQTSGVAATVATFRARNTHTGTVTFDAAHGFNVTAGSGFEFDNADGSYTFNGTVTLNGGDAGIDITNGSAGTFTWVAASSITNPSGVGFNVDTNTAPTITFPGSISKNNTNSLVAIANLTGGSVTLAGTLTSTNTGIPGGFQVSNCTGGTVTLGTISIGTAGSRAQVGASFANNTNLNLTITSLTVFTTNSAALVLATNTGGSITINGGSIDTTGTRCLFVSTSPMTLTLASATSANSSSEGLRLDSASGSLTVATTTVTSAGLEGIRAQSGSAILSFGNATVTRSAANAANEGVELTNHTGATTFTSLNVNTSAGNQTALFASNSGTLTITANANNDLAAGNGRCVDIDNTTLAISLDSVTTDGGTAPGIDLAATTGAFAVTGSGTISNKTGADSSPPTQGVAVVLNNAVGVSLNNVTMQNFTNWAIWGNQVNGFVLTASNVTNSAGFNGTNAGANEGNLFFTNLIGTVTLSNNTISNALVDNIRIVNSTGTLTPTLTNGTIGLNDTTNGGDGIHLEASASAAVTLNANGVTFLGARGSFVDVAASGTANVNVTFTNCNMTNSHTNMAGPGIVISGGGAGSNVTLGYTITGSGAGVIRGGGTVGTAIGGPAISVDTTTGGGTATGVISNLSVGLAAATRSGNPIRVRTGGTFAHNVRIEALTMREIFSTGLTGALELVNSGGPGTTFNTQILSNNVTCSNDGGNFLFYALTHSTTGTGTTSCLRVQNNTLDASALPLGADAVEISYSDGTGTSGYRVPGYVGSAFGETPVSCVAGTASADLGTHWAGLTNTLTNGPSPSGANGVDARRICNLAGGAGSCP